MKKTLFPIAVLFLSGAVCAQNHKIVRAEACETAEGIVVPDMSTALAVDLTVACERFVAGPYARYAQRYLGVRATLSDKCTYEVAAAGIHLLDDDCQTAASLPAATVETEDFGGSATEFARILPDRTSAAAVAPEAAAQSAAEEIFRLRRQRMDLISGEEGENVFGAGLQTALDELKALEKAYTELFFGKRVVETVVHRLVVRPVADRTSYIVCRFSPQDGILPATDLSGEVVLLQIRPTGDAAVQGVREAGDKERYATFRIADSSECSLLVGTSCLAQTTLPLLVFGKDVRVALPSRK